MMKEQTGESIEQRDSPQLLTEILESIDDGIMALDREWRFRYANHQAASKEGFLSDALIGQNLWDIYPQLSGTDFEKHYRKAMAERVIQEFIFDDEAAGKGYAIKIYPSSNGIIVTWHDVTVRKKAIAALEESEEKYRSLFSNMTESFALCEIILDAAGKPADYKFLEVNPAFEKLVGSSHDRLIGKRAKEVAPDIESFWIEIYGKVTLTGQPVIFEDYSPFNKQWVEIYAYSPQPGRFAAHLRDITDRKKAEEALAKAMDEMEVRVKDRTTELAHSEENYRLLVENANEAVMVFQDQKIKFYNPKALDIFGYSPEEMAAQSFAEYIHTDDRDTVLERHLKRTSGEAVPVSYEFKIICKDGKMKWVSINAVSLTWESQPAVLGIITDITEHKIAEVERTKAQKELAEANKQLKQYANKITQVQEEERKRIAYELHDDTAQYLSILKMQLGALISSKEIQSPEIKERLLFLERDADRAFNDVRRYSHELRPVVLEHQGLAAALEQIADDYNKLGQLSVEVQIEGIEPRLSEDIKLGYFRIAQEALNNTRKYAKAKQANIDIRFYRKQVWMLISDNGVGFNVKEAVKKSGGKGSLGLMSMRERADLINADLKIESLPGQGTRVILKANI
jgi:PAS domain S-box-containing protein